MLKLYSSNLRFVKQDKHTPIIRSEKLKIINVDESNNKISTYAL
jgi:hypothetical protein